MADLTDKHDHERIAPMDGGELDAPAMRARIQTARERAARGRVSEQGSAADDLEELAREQRRLAART